MTRRPGDNIDISGFMGQRMQLKVNFLCKDSILAAPLAIEIARCLGLADRRGQGGVQEQMGAFFKAPMDRQRPPCRTCLPPAARRLVRMARRRPADGYGGVSGSFAVPDGAASAGLRDLLRELGDLKRTRSAGRFGSVAERGFVAAWAALCAGEDTGIVMAVSVASALAAARLGDMDAAKLHELGLDEDGAAAVLQRAFDAIAPALCPSQADHLRGALGAALPTGLVPPFVARPGRAAARGRDMSR